MHRRQLLSTIFGSLASAVLAPFGLKRPLTREQRQTVIPAGECRIGMAIEDAFAPRISVTIFEQQPDWIEIANAVGSNCTVFHGDFHFDATFVGCLACPVRDEQGRETWRLDYEFAGHKAT